ncbi:FLYWCH zinc finger domain-containing protein [Phthorimaea operculella]|nr:FLYWCH zinc finger domain-containing protein [Phthorimaea operculella]
MDYVLPDHAKHDGLLLLAHGHRGSGVLDVDDQHFIQTIRNTSQTVLFCLQLQQKQTDRWVCTTSGGLRKCKARIFMNKDRQITSIPCDHHNHPPPKYVILTRIRNTSGKEVLLLDGFSFYLQAQCKTTSRWACTSNARRKCKARVIMNADGAIKSSPIQSHTHPPPQHIVRDGVYIKI